MAETRTVRRYNTYYRGWRLAFGAHQATFDEQRDINWLFSENRIGLALAAGLRRRLYRELLGRHDTEPRLILSESAVRIGEFSHLLVADADREGGRRFRRFLLENPTLHMFNCSHFYYPAGTQIITFSDKKPAAILYKEMQPLIVVVE